MKLHPQSEDAYKLLHNGTLAFAHAEQQGIRLDVDYANQKKEEITERIQTLEQSLHKTRFYRRWEHITKKININSNAQLAHYLYKVKKLEPAAKTVSGQGSTDEDALKALNIPELDQILEIRKLKKIRDTYLEGFLREEVGGYIHPSYNLHLVRTYRSSSDRPNFQNIPKRDVEALQLTRKALFPRPGHQLLEVDYKQLEVRIATCYHNDPMMIKYIEDPTTDMHKDMAEQIFKIKLDKSISSHSKLRAAAKNGFVFPQFYGDYYGNNAVSMACDWGELPESGKWKRTDGMDLPEDTLGYHLINNGIHSLEEFKNHIKDIETDFWKNRFPEYARWKERWWRAYQKHGYIDMLTGFRCSGLMSRNDCTNYPVQGAAFHCLLWSFIELDMKMREEGWDTRLIGQIHDAIIFDVHPDELEHVSKTIRQVTCTGLPREWPWIIVPLDVDAELCPLDGSWAEKEDYPI